MEVYTRKICKSGIEYCNESLAMQLKECITKCLNDPYVFARGSEMFESFLKKKYFLASLLQIACDESNSFNCRQLSIIVLKNHIIDEWVLTTFKDSEKELILHLLISNLGITNDRIRVELSYIISQIVSYDYDNLHPSLIPSLINNCLLGDDQIAVMGSLTTLIQCFNTLGDRFIELVPNLLTDLHTCHQNVKEVKIFEKVFELLYCFFNSCSIFEHTDTEKFDRLLPEEKTCEWLLICKNFSLKPIEFPHGSNYNLVRLALKAQDSLYSDIESRGLDEGYCTIKECIDCLAFYLETFLKETYEVCEDANSDDEGFLAMISQLIELTTTLLKLEETEDDFLNVNQMYTVLLYMNITKEQESLFQDDPNQYISDEDNEYATKDLKSWANDFMNEVIDQHEEKIPIILQAIERLLIRPEETKHSSTNTDSREFIYCEDSVEFRMKCIEAGLYCLGNLPDGIQSNNNCVDSSILTIIDSIVIPYLQNPDEYPEYIQMRALWVLKQKKRIITDPKLKDTVFQVAGHHFLDSNNLAIKLSACEILPHFQSEMNEEQSEALLQEILKILEEANAETVSIPLLYFKEFTKDSSIFKRFINSNIVEGILVLFQKYHIDPFVGDDFCSLLKSWVYQDLSLTSELIVPFIMNSIVKEHESSSKPTTDPNDEVTGTAIFDYSLDMGECILEVSKAVGKLPDKIDYKFFESLSQVLVETNEIFIQTTLLGFYHKLVGALISKIQESHEAIGLIKAVIEKFLDNTKVYERGILHIGELVVTYLSNFTSSPVEDFIAITPMILTRLYTVSSSNILEALLYPFLHMCLTSQEETLSKLEDREIQIFVDNLANYAERGAFRNKNAKNGCLKVILMNIVQRIHQYDKGCNDTHKSNLCSRLTQIREYPPLFAFILMICRMVERQSISDEFDEYDSFCNIGAQQPSDTTFEKQCLEKIRSEISNSQTTIQELKSLIESLVQPKEAELIQKYMFTD
ncbi:unnamed protein product [Moneuplotes crassus]|uniref:Importin N-terminal domain-containing protein n=1 Tax=Euplotes crassus TaxID=5936 RepID=A0AAD1XTJ8_EUPCR|nr:unnamed protein product [Moneuplotes crassus]